MKFTVLWTRTADNMLAQVWINAVDRDAVVEAASTVDATLKSDPLNCGESREGDLRIAFVPPLGIDFEVSVPDRLVYVLTVWNIPKA